MHITSGSEKETLALGKRIARHLRKGDIVCLFGDLGSGKTVMSKGIAEGLSIEKKEVLSPTFVLMRQYNGSIPMYHFDLYRLQDTAQIRDLGYEEYMFDNGVSVIEWADRLRELTPQSYLKITLEVSGEHRRKIGITAVGESYKGVLRAIDKDTRA